MEKQCTLLELMLDSGKISTNDVLNEGAEGPHAIGVVLAFTSATNAKRRALFATLWCLQTVRSAAGGATDGLEELVCERMAAESTWEYEPRIKRAKY
jgi:hypothetical protein